MRATYPLPASYNDLHVETLELIRKGDWLEGGLGGLSLGALVVLGYVGPAALGLGLAYAYGPAWLLLALLNVLTAYFSYVFMRRYNTMWLGVMWVTVSTKPEQFEAKRQKKGPHEAVHRWHDTAVPWHRTRYAFPVPIWRRQSEGAAYGLDVAIGRRTLDNAIKSFRGWVYFQFMGEADARTLIYEYAHRWRTEVADLPEP